MWYIQRIIMTSGFVFIITFFLLSFLDHVKKSFSKDGDIENVKITETVFEYVAWVFVSSIGVLISSIVAAIWVH